MPKMLQLISCSADWQFWVRVAGGEHQWGQSCRDSPQPATTCPPPGQRVPVEHKTNTACIKNYPQIKNDTKRIHMALFGLILHQDRSHRVWGASGMLARLQHSPENPQFQEIGLINDISLFPFVG